MGTPQSREPPLQTLEQRIQILRAAQAKFRALIPEEEQTKIDYEELARMIEQARSQLISRDLRAIAAQEGGHAMAFRKFDALVTAVLNTLEAERSKLATETSLKQMADQGAYFKGPFSPEWVYSAQIGHYGGVYVKVPSEHWAKFKAAFPANLFPRNAKQTSTRELWTPQGQQRFDKLFPNSMGSVYEVYFANASKGMDLLEKLFGNRPLKGVADE